MARKSPRYPAWTSPRPSLKAEAKPIAIMAAIGIPFVVIMWAFRKENT